MARKHGFFRPHVNGLTAIHSTTLRDGGTWVLSGSQLDLDFAYDRAFNRSTGFNGSPNGILTYTSPSPKMVYGDDGVLRYAPHNLLVYSEAFSNGAYWIDGVISASGTRVNGSVSVSADNGYAYVRQNFTAINKTVVASYEVTCDTTVADVPIVFSNGVTNYPVVTSFVAGVPQRVTSPAFSVTTHVSVGIDLRDAVAPGGSNTTGYTITFNKAQLQLYPNHDTSTYVPTTSAAVYSLPIDHDPITHAPLGVLIEEQRTNLLTYSEQFDNAAWTKSRATVTANATTAPDGTTTADKLVPSVDVGTHRVYQSGITHGVLRTYAYTCYLKAGEYTFARLAITDSTEADAAICGFDLSTGTLDGTATAGGTFSAASASVEDVGDGWYRCTLIATCDATEATVVGWVASGNAVAGASSFAGDGTSGIYVWGAQLEAGAFPTSYIPTVASQVTRAADQVSILTSAFAYSATAGTIAVDAENPNPVGTQYIWQLIFNGSNNMYLRRRDSTSKQQFVLLNASINDVILVDSTERYGSDIVSMAIAFAEDDFAWSIDGGAVLTDLASSPLPVFTSLQIGTNSSTNQFNGHIKRLTYFPTRKTNAELQALSA